MTADTPAVTPDHAGLADPGRRTDSALGYLAHAYTASGLVLVLAATYLALADRFAAAIIALIACVVIDATDGNLARRWRVTETAPGIDGRRLDDIVDFLSFTFVPLLLAVRADLLVAPMAVVTVAALTSVVGFCRTDAKQDAKGFFLGFPSYWNIVIGYLWLFDTPPVPNTVLVLALSALTLAPVRFLYLSRLPHRRDRRRHYLLAAGWGGICITALALPSGPARLALATVSLAYPAYYVWCSLRADLADRRSTRSAPAG